MSDKETENPKVPTEQDSDKKAEGQTQESTEATTAQRAAPSESDSEAAANEGSAKLSGLMSSGEAPAKAAPVRPDLDAEAMLAAQAAIAEGERALAAAKAQLGAENPARPGAKRGAKRGEMALRLLLAANVLAMLVVLMLPSTQEVPPSPAATPVNKQPTETNTKPQQPPPAGPRLADKYNQALLASENREFAKAVALLQEYLDEAPNMPASRLVNVYRAMAHYSSAISRYKDAQDYERRAQAVGQSHSLPEDLVAMAKAAAESNDQEQLRQVWARFLLQQRQIPSSLYQHVAEAYLQLGDSYRVQANQAAERARIEELRRADELLREQGKKR